MKERDATHVRSSGKADKIAQRTAPDRYDKRAPIELLLGEEAPHRLKPLSILPMLAARENEDAAVSYREGGRQPLQRRLSP